MSDLSDLSDLSDKLVRHGIPRGFACRSEVWLGAELPQGYAGNVMATVVCSLRGRDACVGPVGPVGPV